MHCLNSKNYIYSITEWISYYRKFQELLNLKLFRNYRNKKLFELWRGYLRKMKRNFFTEKISLKLFFTDPYLRNGVIEIRRILDDMIKLKVFNNVINIFK